MNLFEWKAVSQHLQPWPPEGWCILCSEYQAKTAGRNKLATGQLYIQLPTKQLAWRSTPGCDLSHSDVEVWPVYTTRLTFFDPNRTHPLPPLKNRTSIAIVFLCSPDPIQRIGLFLSLTQCLFASLTNLSRVMWKAHLLLTCQQTWFTYLYII